MNSSPLVTIVTPVYNQRIDYLDEAATSVVRQTDPGWRWLIADNHSAAEVTAWLDERARDPRVRVLRQSTNVGVFRNLNAALLRVETPFVLALCSDDRLTPDAVARYLGMAERFPQADLLIGSFSGVDENGRPAASSQAAHQRAMTKTTRVLPRHEALELVFRFGSINGNLTGMFFRRSLFDRIGPFHTEMPHTADWEWIYRAAKGGSILLSTERVAEVRTHSGQLSSANHKSGDAVRDAAAMVRRLMADPELRDHPRAQRWARHHMQGQAWLVARSLLRGDLPAAKQISAEIHSTTGLVAAFAQLLIDLPVRLRSRLSGRPRMPPA